MSALIRPRERVISLGDQCWRKGFVESAGFFERRWPCGGTQPRGDGSKVDGRVACVARGPRPDVIPGRRGSHDRRDLNGTRATRQAQRWSSRREEPTALSQRSGTVDSCRHPCESSDTVVSWHCTNVYPASPCPCARRCPDAAFHHPLFDFGAGSCGPLRRDGRVDLVPNCECFPPAAISLSLGRWGRVLSGVEPLCCAAT